ncbi:hypothetical protein NDU88_007874 [Pleurodeles waltl]|uniref:Uncharacterized protein n=1 Tax=Pleurodeles waltl TaxID=8319 RepID=A0AAV7NYN1_PLEWA|nr:hypothetical protein NDU88_007874 [Pleurodeles waltl]
MALDGAIRPALPGLRGKKPRRPDSAGVGGKWRMGVPFLQEDGPNGGVVAAVEPAESEEEEDEEDDTDNRDTVIQQYFQ